MAKPEKVVRMSVDEYLRFEESATVKHEYVDGEVFEMTGGTLAHNLIGGNILTLLRARLKGSGCKVYIEAVKVRIESTNSFYYPDLLVDCCAYDGTSVYTTTPVIIFEVLSRSTASTDRREKLIAYKRIPSLKAYVLVHQARKCVEVFRKESDGNWTIQIIESYGELLLETVPGEKIVLTLEEIYDDLNLESSPDLQVREDVETYSVCRP